jgi:hypothetical protein
VRIAAIAIAFVFGGCSAILSQPPQSTPLASPADCSTSIAPPVGDVILAAVSGGIASAGLGIAGLEKLRASNETAPSWDPHPTADANANTYLVVGLAAVPAAVALVMSARHGFRNAKACRVATGDLQRQREPPPLGPERDPR